MLQDLDDATGGMTSGYSSGQWELQPRVRYLPAAKRLIVIPDANDRIVSYHFDLDETLRASSQKYLHVISRPPGALALGGKLSYQIAALSSSGALKYRLESGPTAARVSPTGLVEWAVSGRPIGGVAQFIISVSDGVGQDALHSFELVVGNASLPGVAGQGAVSPKAAASEVAQIAPMRLELPNDDFFYVPGYRNGSMLALAGDNLAVIARDGITLQKNVNLPKAYVAIAERSDYYVAVSVDPLKAVDILDKQTLRVLRSMPLQFLKFTDLALHPTLPLT